MAWVKRWEVPKSSGQGCWIVAVNERGDYGCSCPRWKFKRIQCHHIEWVKNCPEEVNERTTKEIRPGNVGEVTERNGVLLYPLVPIYPFNAHLAATIIYDLNRLGANRRELKAYKNQMFPKNSMSHILEYVRTKGRYVYTEFVEGQGWCKPDIKLCIL